MDTDKTSQPEGDKKIMDRKIKISCIGGFPLATARAALGMT